MIFARTPAGLPIRHSPASIRLTRRLARFAVSLLKNLGAVLLRAVVTAIVFAASTIAILHYLGVSLPPPSELLDKLEDLGRLAKILS